jgi:aspartate/methionine/tyrosine aminotransferase
MELIVPLAARVRRLQALPPEARDPVARGRAVPVPAAVRAAADEALQRGETHYTDRPGILPLRQQVARRLARDFGAQVDAAKGVVITCGGTEARFVAVQQLLPEGGTLIALSHPERVAAACIVRDVNLVGPDATVVGPDATVVGPDATVVGPDATIASDARVALYLNGETPDDVADPWLQRAQAARWPVVFEADAGGRHPAALGLAEQTITIGSLGLEEGMASWRLGFLAAPAAQAGPLRDFKQALTICTTNVSQWGALALEGDPA